jgi:hypothetical protein
LQRFISKGAETAAASFSADKMKDPTLQRLAFVCKSDKCDGQQREAVLFLANNDDTKMNVMLVCLTCKDITRQHSHE